MPFPPLLRLARVPLTACIIVSCAAVLLLHGEVFAQSDDSGTGGSDAAPLGFCCVPSYSLERNGECAPNETEAQCENDDPTVPDEDEGILWTGEAARCQGLCGEQIGLLYCKPEGGTGNLRDNWQCSVGAPEPRIDPVTDDYIDPLAVRLGRRTQEACTAICHPSVDVETQVLCTPACMRDPYFRCEITVINNDHRDAALVSSVTVQLDWMGDGTSPAMIAGTATVFEEDENGDQVEIGEAYAGGPDPDDPQAVRWPYGSPGESVPMLIPALAEWHAWITIPSGYQAPSSAAAQSSAAGAADETLVTVGRVTATAVNLGDTVPYNNQNNDYIEVGDRCGLRVTQYCTPLSSGADSSASSDGQNEQRSPPRVQIGQRVPPVEHPEPGDTVITTAEVTHCINQNAIITLSHPTSQSDIAASPTARGCYIVAPAERTPGQFICVTEATEEGDFVWLSGTVDEANPDCAPGTEFRTRGTVQMPRERLPTDTNEAVTRIRSCGRCDVCSRCKKVDGADCDQDTCENQDPYKGNCTWIPDSAYEYDNSYDPEVDGECRADPEKPQCDYGYACCTVAGYEDGSYDTDPATGQLTGWYTKYGDRVNRQESEGFADAKACFQDDDEASPIWSKEEWPNLDDIDHASYGIDHFRRMCTDTIVRHSWSSNSRSFSSVAPEKVNLWIDRELVAGRPAECRARDKADTSQTPLLGTTAFVPPTYSTRIDTGFLDEQGQPDYRTIGDPAADGAIQCEYLAEKQRNMGLCCLPTNPPCEVRTAWNCVNEGVLLPFAFEAGNLNAQGE